MGTVAYDPRVVSPDDFIAGLFEMTGYEAIVTKRAGLSLDDDPAADLDDEHNHEDPDHAHPENGEGEHRQ